MLGHLYKKFWVLTLEAPPRSRRASKDPADSADRLPSCTMHGLWPRSLPPALTIPCIPLVSIRHAHPGICFGIAPELHVGMLKQHSRAIAKTVSRAPMAICHLGRGIFSNNRSNHFDQWWREQVKSSAHSRNQTKAT